MASILPEMLPSRTPSEKSVANQALVTSRVVTALELKLPLAVPARCLVLVSSKALLPYSTSGFKQDCTHRALGKQQSLVAGANLAFLALGVYCCWAETRA